MNEGIARTEEMERFLDKISGQESGKGNPRVKQLVRRIVSDLYRTIDDLDVQPEEYWAALSLLAEAGQSRELGLLSAGLGFDHFLDLRMDARDRETGAASGTARTIEGPLYVAGAPLSKGEARLDDGSERGEPVLMMGRVLDTNGRPIAGAIVDVWHANSLGNYSFFDRSQAPYNLRRRIETDADGRYRFRSILPAGYGVAPGAPTTSSSSRWDGTGSVRRTSTFSSRGRDSATSPRRSTSREIHFSTTTSPLPRATSSSPSSSARASLTSSNATGWTCPTRRSTSTSCSSPPPRRTRKGLCRETA